MTIFGLPKSAAFADQLFGVKRKVTAARMATDTRSGFGIVSALNLAGSKL
jgi:hypothetical protein